VPESRRGSDMADVVFLPRVFVGQTRYGTKVYWDQRRGLLASYDGDTELVPIQADKLRTGFPAIWSAWLQLAALLPPNALIQPTLSPSGSGDWVA
jgi:hypothetical protein